jgi:hypothetical protein
VLAGITFGAWPGTAFLQRAPYPRSQLNRLLYFISDSDLYLAHRMSATPIRQVGVFAVAVEDQGSGSWDISNFVLKHSKPLIYLRYRVCTAGFLEQLWSMPRMVQNS